MKSALICLLISLPVTGLCAGRTVSSGIDAYRAWLNSCIGGIKADMPAITASAEDAARKFVMEDYELAPYGDTSFVYELTGRAGGLIPVSSGAGEALQKHIVLFPVRDSMLAADTARVLEFEKQGNMVVVFARRSVMKRLAAAGVREGCVIDNHAAPSNGLFDAGNGKWIVPTDGPASVVAAWTWIGEFVGACRRLGKMPAMYQSIRVPGSTERNQPLLGKRFHDTKPESSPAGRLGRLYLEALRSNLSKVYREEHPDLVSAAVAAKEARASGHSLYFLPYSHLMQNRLGIDCDPGYFRPANKGWSEVHPDARPGKGDVLLIVGYDFSFSLGEFSGSAMEAFISKARTDGVLIRWCLATYNQDEMDRIPPEERAALIDQHWTLGDAAVSLPDYDVRILPTSGVVSDAVFWAINAGIFAAAR